MLIGRTRELEELSAFARRAAEGRGGLAILSGDAGIGKTRLADEVAATALAHGVHPPVRQILADAGAVETAFDAAFFNINTREDLAVAESRLRAG